MGQWGVLVSIGMVVSANGFLWDDEYFACR